ncbi:MAG: acyltransferase family protein [Rhodanobacteraceae bacterium]
MSERGHVFGLDFLRAFAVALVLITHASFLFLPLTRDLGVFDAWWMLGQLGVELFFVLSGFLIGGMLANEAATGDLDVRQFWIRRWLRTLPNYYLFLLVNFLIERWVNGAWPHAASYLVFWQNFAWPSPMFYGESWSLAIEEIFYLVAPLLVLYAQRHVRSFLHPVALIALVIAAFTLIRIVFVLHGNPTWDEGVRKVTLVRLDAIAYGVVAVLLYRRYRPSLKAAGVVAALGIAGIAVCAWSYLALPRDTSFFARTLLFNLISISFAALLPIGALWRNSGLPTFLDGSVRKLALWSYALYVSHLALLRVLVPVFGWKGTTPLECAVQAVGFCVLAIALAALVHRIYEAPLLRLRDAIAPKTAPATT